VKHETWARSDALLRADGIVPETISSRQLSLGSYPAPSQFSRAIFEAKSDAIVLSIQPDVTNQLFKHRGEGFLLNATDSQQWSAEDKAWLKSDFDFLGLLDVAESMANFAAIVEKIREQSEAAILIYNMSPIVPGETIHCHQGMDQSYSTRIRRFNLGLIELSEATGVSIIDVDSLVARKGADALKLDAIHLTPPGYQTIAEEVVRVLEDLGVLAEGKS
jgi:lysophospholipase L1-like esterase